MFAVEAKAKPINNIDDVILKNQLAIKFKIFLKESDNEPHDQLTDGGENGEMALCDYHNSIPCRIFLWKIHYPQSYDLKIRCAEVHLFWEGQCLCFISKHDVHIRHYVQKWLFKMLTYEWRT